MVWNIVWACEVIMFREFQGEVPSGDGFGSIVSVCLHMGEWLVRGILNSNNHLHSYRVEWVMWWAWYEVLAFRLVLWLLAWTGLTMCVWLGDDPLWLDYVEFSNPHRCTPLVYLISKTCIWIIEFSVNCLCDYRHRYVVYHVYRFLALYKYIWVFLLYTSLPCCMFCVFLCCLSLILRWSPIKWEQMELQV